MLSSYDQECRASHGEQDIADAIARLAMVIEIRRAKDAESQIREHMATSPIGKGDKCPETNPRNTAKKRNDLRSKGDTDRGIVTDCQIVKIRNFANSI